MRVLLTAAIVLLLVACRSVTVELSGPRQQIQEELNRRRGLWADQQLTSYQYNFSRQCECAPDLLRPVLVEVSNAALNAVTYTDDGTAVPASALNAYFTVEGLFNQIQVAIRELADSIIVTYDPARHYPASIRIDIRIEFSDDQISFLASDLTPR